MRYFQEGIQAYLTGIAREHNPYFATSEAEAQWAYGWDSARYESLSVGSDGLPLETVGV